VYVYSTAAGVEAVASGKFTKVYGSQAGCMTPTSEGYLVPPFGIRGCAAVQINDAAWEHVNFLDSDSLSVKGRKAEKLIVAMVRSGLLPFPALSENITDAGMQISGGDIIVKLNAFRKDDIIIQVKCDYRGGEKEFGGTGNLFLQVSESNPFGYR
jgi:hypothetical protein